MCAYGELGWSYFRIIRFEFVRKFVVNIVEGVKSKFFSKIEIFGDCSMHARAVKGYGIGVGLIVDIGSYLPE